MRKLVMALVASSCLSLSAAEKKPVPDFSRDIAPVLNKHCAGCHNPQDREGKLSLESFADLSKGGKHGPAVQGGNLDSSRLYLMLTGRVKPAMPPKGEEPLRPEQIELFKQWIEAGAKGPDGVEPVRRELTVPKVPAAKLASQPIAAIAVAPHADQIAVARFQRVELRSSKTHELIRQIEKLPGKVNSVDYSVDGAWLVTGSGIPGLFGQAAIWDTTNGQLVRTFEGHRDTLYDATLSPDRQVLATASYDRKITLWDTANGKQLRTLDGHNGAVFDLAFNPSGTILASASADQTIKLWQVATGVRLDTLSQPLKEQYTVAFSPNGEFVAGGGLDNRLRVWRVVSKEKPQINPLLFARFAHEGAVLRIAFSPDGKKLVSVGEDQTLKLWETTEFTQLTGFERQPDVTPALAFERDNAAVSVGRVNGSLQRYDVPTTVAAVTAPMKVADAAPMQVAETFQQVAEVEPNDAPLTAGKLVLPAKVKGVISAGKETTTDADLYEFQAKAGEKWVFEVHAARASSMLDSKLEVLDAQGKRIPRVLLQAVRDSYVTFRGIDSATRDCRLHNWEEMDLNQLVYMNGEVAKLWLWPRGPDSGFVFYPHTGNRHTFFDTTSTSHALNEPAYVVEAHAPGSKPLPNGLPIFTVYYENDDDSERELGTDSRLTFTAPADGTYLVRVSDVRGFHGEKFSYELTARPHAPSFSVKLSGENPTLERGSGKEFSITVDRTDGFEGEIQVNVEGLPPGMHVSSPLFIQHGQSVAYGALTVSSDAPALTPEIAKATKVSATATINGQGVKKDCNNFGELKLADKPKLLVAVVADQTQATPPNAASPDTDPFGKPNPFELTIAPGQTITAKVRVQRNGFDGRVPFEAIAQNLPHGIIIDNVGLSGLLIVEGQTERQFFITAAPWVPETTRVFHLKATVEGNQVSWPVKLHVKRAP